MTALMTKPHCGLCNEPKFKVQDVWLCSHCDTTVNCPGDKCGACDSARRKTYPVLADD